LLLKYPSGLTKPIVLSELQQMVLMKTFELYTVTRFLNSKSGKNDMIFLSLSYSGTRFQLNGREEIREVQNLFLSFAHSLTLSLSLSLSLPHTERQTINSIYDHLTIQTDAVLELWITSLKQPIGTKTTCSNRNSISYFLHSFMNFILQIRFFIHILFLDFCD
jgi:hypothetical protein